jgi:hypothetical protein
VYEPDGSFTRRVPVAAEWQHLGPHAPTLRTSVGSILRVRVRNRSRFPASLHILSLPLFSVSRIVGDVSAAATKSVAPSLASPSRQALPGFMDYLFSFLHIAKGGVGGGASGVSTLEQRDALDQRLGDPFSSGFRATVCDGVLCQTMPERNLDVLPGETLEFTWTVGESAGPEEAMSSVGRVYQSLSYDSYDDPALAGMVIVHRKGASVASRPPDVAAELVVIFSNFMESESPYLPLNVLDFVFRPRFNDVVSVSFGGSNFPPLVRLMFLSAAEPSSAAIPVPAGLTPAVVLAALYNAAARCAIADAQFLPPNGLVVDTIDASDPIILGLVGGADALSPELNARLPGSVLGLTLSKSGSITLYGGAEIDAAIARKLNLLDGTGFAALYGQVALEEAIAPLVLQGLELEDGFDADGFQESNTMHALNGMVFCNAQGFRAILGAVTRWYVVSLGESLAVCAREGSERGVS